MPSGNRLNVGSPTTLKANVVYALPAFAVTLYTDAVAPTIAVSNDPTFAVSSVVTLNAGSVKLAGSFIRAGADLLVTLKRD
jgi:hypothetical protein